MALQDWPVSVLDFRGHSDPEIGTRRSDFPGTDPGAGAPDVGTLTWPMDLPVLEPSPWHSEGDCVQERTRSSEDGESTKDNSPPSTPPSHPVSPTMSSRLSLSFRGRTARRTRTLGNDMRAGADRMVSTNSMGSTRMGADRMVSTNSMGSTRMDARRLRRGSRGHSTLDMFELTTLMSRRTTGGREEDVEPDEHLVLDHRFFGSAPIPCVRSSSLLTNPDDSEGCEDYPFLGLDDWDSDSMGATCSRTGDGSSGTNYHKNMERAVDIMMSDFPEVRLRAIRAYKALGGFGWMFRSEQNMFDHSHAVEQIEDFWSYSRHANWCDITCMLLLYYNGIPALLAGCVASGFTPWLLRSELLNRPRFCSPADDFCRSKCEIDIVVSMLIGVLVTAAVAILWPTWRRVFLDKACIPQDNDMEKRQGILNLGFFIENSRKMMVLWEPTYFTRLWCVFELAAYLKLQADGFRSHQLEVLPVSYARMTALCFLGDVAYVLLSYWLMPMFLDSSKLPAALCEEFSLVAMIIVFMFLGVAMDSHVKAIHSMTRQLNEFSIEDADCFCCSNGHVNPDTKVPLDCDRELIQGAVSEWFGDVGAFNDFVRIELQKHISLKANFPYRYALLAFLPHLLYGLAKTGEVYMIGEDNHKAAKQLINTLMKVCLLGPAKWSMCFLVFGLQKRKQKAGPSQSPLTIGRIMLLTAGMTLVRRLWITLAAYPAPYSCLMQLLVYGPFVLKEYWGHF